MISVVFKAYKRVNSLEPVIIKMKRKNIQQKLDVHYKVAINLEGVFGEETGQLYQINQKSK
jgi:hypothetical protein